MSDQISFTASRSPARSSRLPFLLWVAACAAIFALVLVLVFPDFSNKWPLLATAIGGGALALVARRSSGIWSDKSQSARQLFEKLKPHSHDTLFLTDVFGTAVADSDGFAQNIPAPRSGRDAIIYRILERVRQQGHGQESYVCEHSRSFTLFASVFCGDYVLWRLCQDHLAVAPKAPQHATGFIQMICDGSGEVSYANPSAQAILGRMPRTIGELVEGDKLESGGLYSLKSDASQTVRAFVGERLDGDDEIILAPVSVLETAGADLDQLLERMPVALTRIEPDGTLIFANESARVLLGDAALAGVNLGELIEGLGRSITERLEDVMRGRRHSRTEVARGVVNDREIFLQVTLTRIEMNGEPALLVLLSDATELKTLEAQFVQSQKMQAVGQLAGGVAHDFNNLLTAINGHCDLLMLRHDSADMGYSDLVQIQQNANRAASLVRQLLAFSRKQNLQPRVLDLKETLADLAHLLNRLLGEKVTLEITNGRGLHPIRVDKRQFEQVVMNLVVNARDAIVDRGTVKIRTSNKHFAEDMHRDRAVVPMGDYILVEVVDSGSGIPEDKIAQIFEPFFTTKPTGEGTGLGLSTAYGIIKQTGGFIFADSPEGEGARFTIYLPAYDGVEHELEVAEPVPLSSKAQDFTGSGVVLLVEDEAPVRSFAARALSLRGYTVIEAESAEDALEQLEDEALEVDVFVSDVIMPGKDGPTWVREALESRPDVRVVFVSGYAEDAFKDGQPEIEGSIFLPKPFSLTELTEKVKEQINAKAAAAP